MSQGGFHSILSQQIMLGFFLDVKTFCCGDQFPVLFTLHLEPLTAEQLSHVPFMLTVHNHYMCLQIHDMSPFTIRLI